METTEKTAITVETTIQAPIEKTWQCWVDPKHIVHWNNASDDWHTPRAENDFKVGGRLLYRMEAKDGSVGFDFTATYNKIVEHQQISYTMDDGRKADVIFSAKGNETTVTETFEAEQTHPIEMQQTGWQAILNNFKKYVEGLDKLEKMHFEISINSNAEKVYQTMIDKKQYAAWTEAFNPTSRYEGSWEKGARIKFLGTDKNGNTEGMVSCIKENIPNKFISIQHLGLVQNEKEITSGPEVEGWAGALENYTFTEEDGKTLLGVDIDANEEFKTYFTDTWPKALSKLKAICEA